MEKLQDIKQHPYMQYLEGQLIFHKKKLECLQKRLVLIDFEKASKSEYQRNEDELTKIKTVMDIEAMQKLVGEKEGYYINMFKNFIADMQDMEENGVYIVAEAENSKDEKVKTELEKFKFVNSQKDANPESVLNIYKKIKVLMDKHIA